MLDPVEEIKTRIDIVGFIREYVPLQSAGANLKARCPFHQEKSGSFMVSQQKQMWHCFGCGTGGDLFSFLMKIENIDFAEALRLLAARAGVELPRHDPRIASQKNRLLDLMDLASQYYTQALIRSPKALSARAYAERRGLDTAIADEFRIGYALPDESALYDFLLSRKFHAAEVMQAGLAVKREYGHGFFDRFRNRLMIPIRNVYGAVIGFGGRILDETERGPKYINSPQTPLYDKSRVVFGLDKAKNDIREKGFVILVEGYMDFFALFRVGVKNVVATSGTALTREQILLIKRFTPLFYFAFDADSAGSSATVRGIECALKEGVDVRVVRMPTLADGTPKYKDPDECVKASPEEWHTAVSTAVSFVEYHIDRTLHPHIRHDSFETTKAARSLLHIVNLLPDRITQDFWIRKIAREASLSEHILWEELAKLQKATSSHTSSFVQPSAVASSRHYESVLLGLVAKDPYGQARAVIHLHPDCFTTEACRDIYKKIQKAYAEHKETGDREGYVKNIQGFFSEKEPSLMCLLAEKEYGQTDEASLREAVPRLVAHIQGEYRKKRITELQRLMQEAESKNDRDLMERYAQEFYQLHLLG